MQSWAVLSLVPSHELSGALDGFVKGLVNCMEENGIHVPNNRQGGTQPPIVYVGEGEDAPPSLNSDLFDVSARCSLACDALWHCHTPSSILVNDLTLLWCFVLMQHVLVKGTAAFRKTPQLLLVILGGNGSCK